MDREELIDRIAAVLVAHDSGIGPICCCGKRLYSDNEGSMSLRRHRSECIIDALGLDLRDDDCDCETCRPSDE